MTRTSSPKSERQIQIETLEECTQMTEHGIRERLEELREEQSAEERRPSATLLVERDGTTAQLAGLVNVRAYVRPYFDRLGQRQQVCFVDSGQTITVRVFHESDRTEDTDR